MSGSTTINTEVMAGTYDTGLTASPADTVTVDAGGGVSDTTVYGSSGPDGNVIELTVNGEADGTTILAYGDEEVDGTSASDSGATISGVGAEQYVDDGAHVTGAVVADNGIQFVDDNSVATSTVVNANGIAEPDSTNAVEQGLTVNAGGFGFIGLDQVANDLIGYDIAATPGDFGTITAADVASGGIIVDAPGGTANRITVEKGGIFFLNGGTLTDALLAAPGAVEVIAQGFTFDTPFTEQTTAFAAGEYLQLTDDPVVVTNNTVTGGLIELISFDGTTQGSVIENAGTEEVTSGGTAENTSIVALGTGNLQIVSSSGLAADTKVYAGGEQFILMGGTATDTSILRGGMVQVGVGATLLMASVEDTGTLLVYGSVDMASLPQGALMTVSAAARPPTPRSRAAPT